MPRTRKTQSPRFFKYDLGVIGGMIIVWCGPSDTKSFIKAASMIGPPAPGLEPDDTEGCFGLCYNMGNGKSIVWIDPDGENQSLVEGVVHELSHAVDNVFKYFSYTCNELRARVIGAVTSVALKDLGLIK